MIAEPIVGPVAWIMGLWALAYFLWRMYDRNLMRQAVKMVDRQTSRLDDLGVDPEAQSLINRMQLVAQLEPEDMEWLDATGATWHRGHAEEIKQGVAAAQASPDTVLGHVITVQHSVHQMQRVRDEMLEHIADMRSDVDELPKTLEKDLRAQWNAEVLEHWQMQADRFMPALRLLHDKMTARSPMTDELLTELDSIMHNICGIRDYLCTDHQTSHDVRKRTNDLHGHVKDTLDMALSYRDSGH